MGFKIQFENGHEVEFDSKPSEADIDEAFHATQKLGPKSSGGFMDAISQGMQAFGGITKDIMGALPQFGGTVPKDEAIRGPAEALAHAGSSIPAFMTGLALSPIAAVRDPSQSIPEHAGRISDALTYEPKTDVGQDLSKPFDEAMYRMQGMVGHATPDLPQGTHNAPIPKADIPTPTAQVFKKKAAGPDLVGAAKEVTPGAADSPPLRANAAPGTQGMLFDPSNDGLASPYDASTVGTTEPIQPRTARAQMDLPLGDPELPPVLNQNRAGVSVNTGDAGLQASVQRGVDPSIMAMEEMKNQLTAGDHSPVDTTLPRGGAMEDMTGDIRARGAQDEINARQAQMEQDVARQQNLDFNAAERQRQDQAPVPGLDNHLAEQKYAEIQQKVSSDPRVTQAEARADAAAKVYMKAASAMEDGLQASNPKLLKRLETDLKFLQESVDSIRANVEYENLINARRNDRIRSDTRMGRQRGAWDPSGIKDAFEKLTRGAIDADKYLESWKGAFNPSQWDKVLRDLKDPNSTRTVALMSPREFHRLAEPRGVDGMQDAARLHQNIKGALEGDKGLLDAPTLWLKRAADGQAQVITHEGRNRMDVFRDSGIAKVPVVLESKDIKWSGQIPEKVRPEWVGDKTVLDMPMPSVMHDGPPSPHRTLRTISPGGKQSGAIMLESNKKKALENLSTKLGIETKLKEIAPSQWTVQEAIDQAKRGQDVDQNFLQRALNYATKGGLYQALKTHNPLVRYTFEKFIDADRKARADIRDWVHGRLAPAMRELSNKEQGQIWTILELADLNQTPVDLEMLARKGFNEKQINFAKEHSAAMDAGYAALNKAREAAGKDPIEKRVAYAAMRASGDFRRLVYDKPGGNVVGVIGSDFRKGLGKLSDSMVEKGFHVGEERYYGGMPRERGSANQAFMNAIESLADKDPRVQDFVDVLNQIRTTEVYNFLNAKTHTMAKKGVDGMQGRKSWLSPEENAKEGMKAQLNYLEAAFKWGHLSDAAKDVKQVMDHPDVKMPNAKAWSEKYAYNALGFNPSDVGRSMEQTVAEIFKSTGVGYSVGRQTMAVARKVTNSLLLSLNPRFWATNIVQPLQAMPGMKAMLIARGLDAGFDFGSGASYLVDGAATAMKKRTGQALTPFEQQAVAYANRAHVYGSDMIEHSNQVRKGAEYYADKAANAVAGNVESSTRQLVFYGMAHLLRENGMPIKEGLFEAAHNLTDMAMNNYSTLERPPMYNTLGPLGDLAVNLQSYKHNELSRLALFARHAQEYQSLRPVVAQLGASVAFGGIMGVVAYNEADQLWRLISKAMGKPSSLTNLVLSGSEALNKKVNSATGGAIDQPYVLSHGLPSMLGIDMSNSLGLTDVVPNHIGDALFPGGSKLGEVATAGYDMATKPSEMNAKRLGRAASPIGIQGALDNQWFTQDTPQGKLAVQPNNLKGQAYRNGTDYWAKNLGFTGVHESAQRQKTYNVEKNSRDYADLRQGPLDKMRDQLFASGSIDKATISKYLQYRGNPETLVSDLERYAQEQHLSAYELSMLRAASSSAVGAQLKAQEYLDMFKK